MKRLILFEEIKEFLQLFIKRLENLVNLTFIKLKALSAFFKIVGKAKDCFLNFFLMETAFLHLEQLS